MKRKFNIMACCLFALVLILQCEEDRTYNGQNLDYIRYGTSFNMCMGYCIRQVEITQTEIKFVFRGWNFTDTIPDIICPQDITTDEWNFLTSKIDMDSFNSLPEFIGCPDCADGGAEWIEISREGDAHKVIFEYGSEPQEVESYINLLRSYMQPDIYCQ